MPFIPAKYRKYCYTVSVAVIPLGAALGYFSDSLVPLLITAAAGIFTGSLAASNVTPDEPTE